MPKPVDTHTPLQTVRIGWTHYQIVADMDCNLEGASGCIRYLKDTIALMPNLAPQHQTFVLLHEIIHGILANAGITPDDHNEQQINALANGLIQVLRDNPQLVKVLLGTG